MDIHATSQVICTGLLDCCHDNFACALVGAAAPRVCPFAHCHREPFYLLMGSGGCQRIEQDMANAGIRGHGELLWDGDHAGVCATTAAPLSATATTAVASPSSLQATPTLSSPSASSALQFHKKPLCFYFILSDPQP